MGKNKKYYKKNYYKNNNKKEEKKVTYDKLMHADTITEIKESNNYNKMLIIKYVAVSVVLFAIIIGSLILFRNM